MSLFDSLQQARRAFAGSPDPSGSVLLAAELATAQGELEHARRRIAELREQLGETQEACAALNAELLDLRAPARPLVDPTSPVHRPCRESAERICAYCAPALGFTAPPTPDLDEIGRKQHSWIADRVNPVGGAVIV